MQILLLLASTSYKVMSDRPEAWLAVLVRGHPEAPSAWQSEARNSTLAHDAEHDYMVVLLPKGRVLVYALLGRDVPFSSFPKKPQHRPPADPMETGVQHEQCRQ